MRPSYPPLRVRWLLPYVVTVFFGCAGSGTGDPSPSRGEAGAASGGVGGQAGTATGGSPTSGASSGGGGSAGIGGSGNAGSGGNATAGVAGNAGGAGATNGGSGGTPSAGSGGTGAPGGSTSGGAAGTGQTAGAGGTGAGGAGASGGAGTSGTGGIPLNPSLLSRCTGSNPIRCTLDAPNGNHTVTVALGDPSAASSSRVQTELFRLTVPTSTAAAGSFTSHTFTVNVRAEHHDGYTAPGNILDLLIDGSMPRLRGIGMAPAPSAITVFVAGDSTVCDWDPAATNISSPDQRGWAQALSQYLLPGVAVANYADSGETAGGFYSKFWPGSGPLRAGDYVFIQFGHNDQKNATDIANYKTNLRRYIADARTKNATPVLFTPVGRKGATLANPGFEGLDAQVRELATEDNVALVDLTTLSIQFFRAQPNVNLYFANGGADGTHLSEVGAVEVSRLVAQALKTSTLPLRTSVR